MHPATSIILFTTFSGAGFGLSAITGLGVLTGNKPTEQIAVLVALALAGSGLVSSVFHLRRPDRAWRAFSQWRSSWLSREGILAPVALALLALYGVIAWAEGTAPPVIGVSAALLSLFAVIATGMIYAQLRAVPAWHTPLTVVCFILLAAAGGLLSSAFLLSLSSANSVWVSGLALLLNLLAWGAKLSWWRRLDRMGTGGSSIESATALTERRPVRLLEPPHTGANYLTKEMVHVVGRRHARRLRGIALITGCILPSALLALALAGRPDSVAFGAAVALHLLGVAIERWLFFAEATHVVSLYYGSAPRT